MRYLRLSIVAIITVATPIIANAKANGNSLDQTNVSPQSSMSGTAFVQFTVAPNGTVKSEKIYRSSGNPLIDRAALSKANIPKFSKFTGKKSRLYVMPISISFPKPHKSDKKSDHAKRWFALTNDDECIPSVPRDPAKLIRFDRLNGLDDAVNIFERSHGMPVGVTVAEPESNGMETVYTFFRTEDACEAYAKAKQGSLNQLQ
ncbi:energy transducer TonB [Acidiphilium sp.]|nr:energy transducer TonB [Acidiphilium sp.]